MSRRKGDSGRSTKFTGKVSRLSPTKLQQALLAAAESRLYPASEPQTIAPLTFEKGSLKCDCDPERFWKELGRTVVVLPVGRNGGLAVEVPRALEVLAVHVKAQDHFYDQVFSPALEPLVAGGSEMLKLAPHGQWPKELTSVPQEQRQEIGEAYDTEKLLRAFETLEGKVQNEVFGLYRRLAALSLVQCRLLGIYAEHSSEMFARQQARRSLGERIDEFSARMFNSDDEMVPYLDDVVPSDYGFLMQIIRTQGIGALTERELIVYCGLQHQVIAECASQMMRVVDIYYWEEGVAPSTAVNEFLPDNLRLPPVTFPGDRTNSKIPQLSLSNEAIDSTNTTLEPERFSFYVDALGCKKVVKPLGEFGRRKYEAFLLKSSSGAPYALLDCASQSNAVYIFSIDACENPDQAEWLATAQLSKREVLSTVGTGGPFVRRIFHSKNWQERIKRFLQNS